MEIFPSCRPVNTTVCLQQKPTEKINIAELTIPYWDCSEIKMNYLMILSNPVCVFPTDVQ